MQKTPGLRLDAGLIFLESDVTSVVLVCSRRSMVPDCGRDEALLYYGRIRHVVCDLGRAAPEAGMVSRCKTSWVTRIDLDERLLSVAATEQVRCSRPGRPNISVGYGCISMVVLPGCWEA